MANPHSPTPTNIYNPAHPTLGLPTPNTVQLALRLKFAGYTKTHTPTWFRCPVPIPGTAAGTLCHAPTPAQSAGVLIALCDLVTALQCSRPIDREVRALAWAMVCRHHRCRAGAVEEKLKERIGRCAWGGYLGSAGDAGELERRRKVRARKRGWDESGWEGVMRVREGTKVNEYLRAIAEAERGGNGKDRELELEREAGVMYVVWAGTAYVVGVVIKSGKALVNKISWPL